MTIADLILLANKLGGVSFATLLLLILYGSKVRMWRWGSEFIDQEARFATEKASILADRDWWREVAVRATGLAETQGAHLLKVASKDGTT